MQPFNITILGCSSATPTKHRNPTSQLVSLNNKMYLIDCGEGTQMQLRKFGVKLNAVDRIFISHLHGDHFLGLPGLLGTLHLLGRKKELNIYAPEGLSEIIEIQNKHSDTFLRFKLRIHVLKTKEHYLLYENDSLEVYSIPLSHRVPCCGFLFREKKRKRKLNMDAISKHNVPIEYANAIKSGIDYTPEHGSVIPNELLTFNPPPPRSYAYCSDTAYTESIIPIIQGCDLLFHEATFMEELKSRAHETYHSTTLEAAQIAQKAQVKKLIIGHYSARYNSIEPLLEETKSVFKNSIAAEDGLVLEI